MSNQNEWETVMTADNLKEAYDNIYKLQGLSIHEYRLQRRKKEKVMPEIRKYDSILIDGRYYIVTDEYNHYARDIIGRGRSFEIAEILEVRRDGIEIWRRGES